MITRRETVLKALHEALLGMPGGATVMRNAVLPERIPDAGLVILRDGTPGTPEVTLSPLRWHWQHRAELEVFLRGGDLDERFDALTAAIGALLAGDRTLGGICDWIEAEAPEPADLPVEGATTIRAAALGITLHYTTADALA
ncbi:acyl-CoA transferase [Paracoccus fistulariae]|uniref:Acyl-CoA transferase n=1 Tax=Paracoccus fistulariae TaxID=658446 RepID=A0ABY7SPB0_9RHOB|nr:acyl-CoA transferase [Paracoccus fistulariae]MDB6183042.1 acyl-CoA transferase [Paracoccus fistulariae]WCR08837.1 acyl-CoA transferase [Paracoccus fistulariae]